MTRCPNCGSAIRIGAKFCTSCGFRLTVDEPVMASPVAPSRSPFATTSSSAWSAEPTVAQPAVRATSDGSPDQAEHTEVVEVEPAWTKAEDDDEAESELVDADAAEAETDDEPIDSGTEQSENNQASATSLFAPAPQDRSGPINNEMNAPLESDQPDQLHADIGEDSGDVAVVPDEGANESMPGGRSTHDGIVSTRVVTADPGYSIESGASIPASAAGDPLDEARMLAARLSEVLAAVQTGGGSAPSTGPVVSGIADESDVESLRSVVKSAQARPRDVDVMLDLVLRADTIDAVLADRDLLLAALRGDETAVEESWSSDDDQPSTYPAWSALP